MHIDADDGEAGQPRCLRVDGAGALDRDAELVLGLAGRDLLVRQRVDVRIDAQRDPRGPPQPRGDRREHGEFRLRLDVEAENVLGERVGDLVRGLADAGKRDPRRRRAGGPRAAQFAFGDDVHPGALGRQDRQHRLVGVRLDGVAGQRVEAGEGCGKDAVVANDRRRRIAVEGRADRVGDGGQVDVLGVQHAVARGEMVHRRSRAADRGGSRPSWGRRAGGALIGRFAGFSLNTCCFDSAVCSTTLSGLWIRPGGS